MRFLIHHHHPCGFSDIFFLPLIVRLPANGSLWRLNQALFEFVIVFLMGGVIILSTVGKDRSITNCATAILTVGLMHWLVSSIKGKYPRYGAIVDGNLTHLRLKKFIQSGS